MDSSESRVHGSREGAKYNGYLECVFFHNLFCFNQYGDCEGAMFREGNVSSADRWWELPDPIVGRYQDLGLRMLFRGNAGFAKQEVYEYLEEEVYEYAMRLPANQVLHRGRLPNQQTELAGGLDRVWQTFEDSQYRRGE